MTGAPLRLFHFSEEPNIVVFKPQPAVSPAAPTKEPLVWAVDEEHAYLYYFPRECPRITFHLTDHTSEADRKRFFGGTSATRAVAIESGWLSRMRTTTLYRYELADAGFERFDQNAGYWVSREQMVTPLGVEPVGDLLQALSHACVQVRIEPSLWPLYDVLPSSTLGYSIIRWRNAAPRP